MNNAYDDELPRSAYVHVPFCRHRCGYCNFTLVAGRDDLIEDYLRALRIELGWLGTARSVETLFVGGGTPSYLSAESLDRFLRLVKESFILPVGNEFSVEANPSDISSEKMEVMKTHGVNRISLGVQSFNANKLAVLERDHHAEQVEESVAICRKWFDNISLDLIFGTPGESAEVWENDLRQAMRLNPQHLSTYGLTFERGTQFWNRKNSGELDSVDESLESTMYETAIDRLERAGWTHYEVSNFARSGFRCRHNQAYWTGGEYYAVGPGAASHLDGRRQTNHRSTTTYLKRVLNGESPVAESEELDAEDRARERLIFGLRRMEGVHSTEFEASTGFSLKGLCGEQIEMFVRQRLLEQVGEHLRLTRKGLLVSDSLWPYLLTG